MGNSAINPSECHRHFVSLQLDWGSIYLYQGRKREGSVSSRQAPLFGKRLRYVLNLNGISVRTRHRPSAIEIAPGLPQASPDRWIAAARPADPRGGSRCCRPA